MKTVRVTTRKGLTRTQAIRLAWPKAKKKGKRDFRCFAYNSRTGVASFT